MKLIVRILPGCRTRLMTTLTAATLLILFFSAACSNADKRSADSDSLAEEAFDMHADNDIAMHVRSIIDAINVGQPLDSADYNYYGILTDGTGMPLYTDVQGSPGAWEVKVLTENSAAIRNVYLGDLLPDELVQYILANLEIPDEPLIHSVDDKSDTPASLTVYNAGSCDLIIERQMAKTTNGAHGPLLKIILRKTDLAADSVDNR
ncbi:MAG: hypothetical protein K2I48_02255 [Muribaculaceae bacterium]|nr:hypothetical protein [Muribaculaceae bacterium]